VSLRVGAAANKIGDRQAFVALRCSGLDNGVVHALLDVGMGGCLNVVSSPETLSTTHLRLSIIVRIVSQDGA
jgi:hypothetical protein